MQKVLSQFLLKEHKFTVTQKYFDLIRVYNLSCKLDIHLQALTGDIDANIQNAKHLIEVKLKQYR